MFNNDFLIVGCFNYSMESFGCSLKIFLPAFDAVFLLYISSALLLVQFY